MSSTLSDQVDKPPIPNFVAICAQCSHERQCPFHFNAMYVFQAPRAEVDVSMYLPNQHLKIPSEYWEDLVLPTSRNILASSLDVLQHSVNVPDSSASASISAQPLQDQAVSERKETRREQNRSAQRSFRARQNDLIKAKDKRLEALQGEVTSLSCANGRLTEAVEGMQQKVAELQRQNKVLRRLSMSNLDLSGETRRDIVSVLQDTARVDVEMASF